LSFLDHFASDVVAPVERVGIRGTPSLWGTPAEHVIQSEVWDGTTDNDRVTFRFDFDLLAFLQAKLACNVGRKTDCEVLAPFANSDVRRACLRAKGIFLAYPTAGKSDCGP
jgi:hypothetical protein